LPKDYAEIGAWDYPQPEPLKIEQLARWLDTACCQAGLEERLTDRPLGGPTHLARERKVDGFTLADVTTSRRYEV